VADPDIHPAAFARDLDDISEDDWLDGPVKDIARRFAIVRQLERRLADIRKALGDSLALSMETDTVHVPGWGHLVRSKDDSTAWLTPDSSQQLRDDIRRAVVQDIAVVLETGELDPARSNIANAVVERIWSIIPAFSSIKAAGKTVYNLSIDEYRTKTTSWKVELYEELP
jgi:hypothetical protein